MFAEDEFLWEISELKKEDSEHADSIESTITKLGEMDDSEISGSFQTLIAITHLTRPLLEHRKAYDNHSYKKRPLD